MKLVSSKPLTRRDRTRTALIDAGLRLFAERPIDAVAVDEIVASAGVAKGSFFNHFRDKHAFASTIATDIRRDVENRVAAANCDIDDPLERLTGGMVVAVDFALSEPRRAMVMLRGMTWSTSRDNPLNAGLNEDIDACIAAGFFHDHAKRSGLPFWLGACQMLMISVLAEDLSRRQAAQRMSDTIRMALAGMGVGTDQADLVGKSAIERLERFSI
jgi:AcrR family transcriptional regulator